MWGWKREGGYEGLTDEVVDVEGLVVGPQRVVDVGVPPEVAADDVVGGGDKGHGDGEEEEEAEPTGTHLGELNPYTDDRAQLSGMGK